MTHYDLVNLLAIEGDNEACAAGVITQKGNAGLEHRQRIKNYSFQLQHFHDKLLPSG